MPQRPLGVLWLVLLIPAVPVWLLAGMLAAVATTDGGRLAAWTFLLGVPGAGLLAGVGWRPLRRPAVLAVGGGLGGMGLLCWLAAVRLAPDGRGAEGSALRSVWLDEVRFRRWALANVVPEIDQFTLGSWLAPLVDPFIDAAQAERLRGVFGAVYRELLEDPGFVAVGSAMPAAYLDRVDGHLYVLAPPDVAGPAPVVVFLHGYAGPFEGYQWVWRQMAAERGWAVVSPSFGMGYWQRDEGVALVGRTLEWIREQPELDGERVVLAGLSNGALGVTRAAIAFPGAFDGLLYLSPVLEADRMAEVAAAHHDPVLVLTGGIDRRVPESYVREGVEVLQAHGAEVSLEVDPDQDHFLMFADRPWVDARVGALLDGLAAGELPAP